LFLLAADDAGKNEIVEKSGSTRLTMTSWQNPYLAGVCTMHLTPTSGSRPQHGRDRLGHHQLQNHPPRRAEPSPDLTTITTYIDNYNTNCKPFTWTKPPTR
jgi:hypothetical protein